MPELRNEPPDTDHDRVIEHAARLAAAEREIDSLREWRHDQVAPVMMAIQAQQKRNADDIGRVVAAVDKLTHTHAALAGLPDEFRQHTMNDTASFDAVRVSMQIVHDKLDTNRAERADGQRRVILWVAGLMIAGLAAVVATQWAFISPHLNWH